MSGPGADLTGRLGALAFTVVTVAGASSAVTLTVREAVRTPPVTVTIADTARVATTTTVTVSVHNTTGRARCASIRVAARDRDGHDLASVTAARALELPARARRRVTTRVTLTARQYAERLYRFFGSPHPCPR